VSRGRECEVTVRSEFACPAVANSHWQGMLSIKAPASPIMYG